MAAKCRESHQARDDEARVRHEHVCAGTSRLTLMMASLIMSTQKASAGLTECIASHCDIIRKGCIVGGWDAAEHLPL